MNSNENMQVTVTEGFLMVIGKMVGIQPVYLFNKGQA